MNNNEEKIYKLIQRIADDQKSNNEPISRADVAYILQKDGYDIQDGSQLSETIYKAYKALGEPDSIRQMIVNNREDKSIVDEYQLVDAALAGNDVLTQQLVQNDLQQGLVFINKALTETADVLKLELAKVGTELVEVFKGDAGLKDLQVRSGQLLQNYTKMIDGYQEAEGGVKEVIHDFVALRSCVNSTYMQYANALVDIFGDGIKKIDAKLFDFDKVQWLDTSAMLNQTELEFAKLDENCTLLLGDITNRFNAVMEKNQKMVQGTLKSVKALTMSGKPVNGKALASVGLLMAAFDFINHRIDAQTRTTQMEREFTKLQTSVKKDSSLVKADLMRLAAIYKTLNESYIPKANAFARLSPQVLDADLKKLLDDVYSLPEIAPLKAERDRLLAECQTLEQQINDNTENITLFKSQISNDQGMIDKQADKYAEAQEAKPSQPNIISRAVTLGGAQHKYERKLTDWKKEYGQLVEAYEEAKISVAENEQDLKTHTEKLAENKRKYAENIKALHEIGEKIKKALAGNTEVKSRALKHLNNLVSLLHAAKQVTESKLDESLTQTVTLNISDSQKIGEIPDTLATQINNFAKTVADELRNAGTEATKEASADAADTSKVATAAAVEAVAQNAAALIENWTYLQTDQMKLSLSAEAYDKEVEKLRVAFKQTIDQVENKGEALRDALRRANTSTNNDDLRRALIDLADVPASELTEKDFNDLLNGKKTIEI